MVVSSQTWSSPSRQYAASRKSPSPSGRNPRRRRSMAAAPTITEQAVCHARKRRGSFNLVQLETTRAGGAASSVAERKLPVAGLDRLGGDLHAAVEERLPVDVGQPQRQRTSAGRRAFPVVVGLKRQRDGNVGSDGGDGRNRVARVADLDPDVPGVAAV